MIKMIAVKKMQYLKAFPPLPHGYIKEVSEIGENPVELISNRERVIRLSQTYSIDLCSIGHLFCPDNLLLLVYLSF